jgi:hypothetical protein
MACVLASGLTAFVGSAMGAPGAYGQGEGVTASIPASLMLGLDAEQSGVLQAYQLKNFYYHGRKGETITVQVQSVQLTPQLRIGGINGGIILDEPNLDGKRKLEVSLTLADEGDYLVQVRAKGAGEGAFQLVVRPESTEEEKK